MMFIVANEIKAKPVSIMGFTEVQGCAIAEKYHGTLWSVSVLFVGDKDMNVENGSVIRKKVDCSQVKK